jgi:hypothetical protein
MARTRSRVGRGGVATGVAGFVHAWYPPRHRGAENVFGRIVRRRKGEALTLGVGLAYGFACPGIRSGRGATAKGIWGSRIVRLDGE